MATGLYKDGYCSSGSLQKALTVVCEKISQDFIDFTKSHRGLDLREPKPAYRFPGLKPGDRWCLCALRWREAFLQDKAPEVIFESTDRAVLNYNLIEDLESKRALIK